MDRRIDQTDVQTSKQAISHFGNGTFNDPAGEPVKRATTGKARERERETHTTARTATAATDPKDISKQTGTKRNRTKQHTTTRDKAELDLHARSVCACVWVWVLLRESGQNQRRREKPKGTEIPKTTRRQSEKSVVKIQATVETTTIIETAIHRDSHS